jgi:hypothetical protein
VIEFRNNEESDMRTMIVCLACLMSTLVLAGAAPAPSKIDRMMGTSPAPSKIDRMVCTGLFGKC